MSVKLFRDDPSLFKTSSSFLLRLSGKFCLLVLLWSFSAQTAFSRNKLSRAEMASVLNVINLLLLSDDTSISLALGEFEGSAIVIRDGFVADFDQQGFDVELCFVLSSDNVGISINGVDQTGDSALSVGENCYQVPSAQQQGENLIVFSLPDGQSAAISNISVEPANQTQLTLGVLTRSGWDEKAVRKVLKIFAFGGHSTTQQITRWANMQPKVAIKQMLNFSQHNPFLSPIRGADQYKQTATQYGEFTDFVENLLSSPASNIPIDSDRREKYGFDGYAFDDTLQYLVTVRGLNPFRHMVGFWETNYHLAVNLESNVNNEEMGEYYDVIMRAHESGVPYQRVLAAAAKAAAPAAQYGHENNEWIDGFCFCNDDFAREIHQLYFGIFGEGDEEHHENVTIPNTAAMLSGMKTFVKVPREGREADFPRVFDRESINYVIEDLSVHHGPSLGILRQTISGSGPFEKIDSLVEHSIEHPDSLKNLPIMIVSVIADDNLSEESRDKLRAAWASMGSNKQFLDYIQSYAISDLFHGTEQRKFMSSFWREYYFANKFNIDNIEAYQSFRDGQTGRPINSILDRDDAQSFRPRHNVFGGQTSLEAADSSTVFEDNYNRATDDDFPWTRAAACDDCDQGQPWQKDWGAVIPRVNGQHSVNDVAQWLWIHLTGSLDNYTPLERAHVVAILGASTQGNEDRHFDLPMFLCVYNDLEAQGQGTNDVSTIRSQLTRFCRRSDGSYDADETRWLNKSYSVDELTNNLSALYAFYNPAISNGQIPNLINQLGSINMPLLSDNAEIRLQANRRIHYAMAFISGTPFMLVETGE